MKYVDEIPQEKRISRTEYAIKRFEEEGIRYFQPSKETDRFVVVSENNARRYQFFASTGLILGPYADRGIENMIMIAKSNRFEECR